MYICTIVQCACQYMCPSNVPLCLSCQESSLLSIVHNLLPIMYKTLPIVYKMLHIAYKTLHITCKTLSIVYKTLSIAYKTAPTCPLLIWQFSDIWYRISCDYWMISSGVRVRVNSRRWFRELLWQLQGV